MELDEFRFERTLIASRGERLALTRDAVTFRDGESGRAEVEAINLCEVDEQGLVSRITVFPPDDVDTAHAQLAARASELEPTPNRAAEVAAAEVDAFVRRDPEAHYALYAPTFALDERRSLLRRDYSSEESLASARYVFDIGDAQWERTLLAVRGDRLALVREHVWATDGTFEHESLAIIEVDEGGRDAAHIVFDPDDTASAIAELDARAESLDMDPGA
jgi:hypothetical protein